MPAGETSRQDAAGEFLRDLCGLRFVGAAGGMFCVTAGGKRLGDKVPWKSLPRKALEEWNALAESERRPGAVAVASGGAVDPQRPVQTPPPGGLILKVYVRYLARDPEGKLRHASRQDFASRERLVEWFKVERPDVLNYLDHAVLGAGYLYEANPDFMWLTEAEWKSLLPADPRVGSRFAVSEAITKRLFIYQLDPTFALGESNGWPRGAKDVRAGELTAVVEEASARAVRLRLEGFALLGQPFDPALPPPSARPGKRGVGFEPRLLGYLTYDRQKKAVTRFDTVAVGDAYGIPEGDGRYYYRPGRQPLGVAFELAKGDTPAEQVVPRGGWGVQRMKSYLGTGK